MNKTAKTILAAGLALAVATPALADFKVSGYYRLMGYASEVRSGADTPEGGYASSVGTNDDEGDSRQLIDQRLRMMVTNQLNDNVAIVWHGEVDTVWGEQSKGSIGGGGQVGADGVNVETKNVYLDMKSGDTTARLGIQTLFDAYQGTIFFDDMAGLAVTHKIGGTTLMGAYSKWDEDGSNNRSDWDDKDFYVADLKQKFNDNFTLGASVYFLDDNTADTSDSEAFFYGLNAAFNAGNFGLDGFAWLMDGEVDSDAGGAADYDKSTYVLSAKATMKLDAGDLGLRVIYIPNADDDNDDERFLTPQGRFDFIKENQMQFLTDIFVCNYGKERYAMADAAEAGYGLLAFVLSGNHKLPDSMYLNWGAGYYMADDEERNVRGVVTEREGDSLGYEIAARFGKKYFEKVDVSLNLSYAGYGDFYDKTAVDGDDPDDTYKSYLMVNVPF